MESGLLHPASRKVAVGNLGNIILGFPQYRFLAVKGRQLLNEN